MKGIAIFVTLFLKINLISGQSFNTVTSIASQIDSGNYYVYSNTQKATEFYIQAQVSAKAIENDSLLARTYVGLAVLARLKGDFPKAFDCHQKSLNIHLRQGDQRFIAADYHNIGALFRYADDNEKAKQYLHRGREIREAIQDSSELALSYMQLGIICRKMEQLDSTVYYYNKSFQLADALADQDLLTKVNGNWAALEYYQGNYQQAIKRNLMDIPYLESTGQSKSLSTRYSNISRAYNELKDYSSAIEYMSKAIEIDKREDYKKDLYRHLLGRSAQKRKLGDYKAALSDYRRYKKIRDTVQNLERVKEFTAQKVAFEYEQQQLADSLQFAAEQEQLSLIAQSERSQKNIYLLTSLLLLLVSAGIWFFWRNRKRIIHLELEKKQLEGALLEGKLQNTQKEAARIVAENQFRLEQKKDLLQHLKNLRRLSQNERMTKELNLLATKMNLQLSKEEKQLVFEEDIAQLLITFEERLMQQFPKLTKSEREVCKLLRMDKSNQEIMELRGVSYSSIRSMRYRIRKKMGLENREELEQFLKEF